MAQGRPSSVYQNSGVELGKGTRRAGVKHRTVYGHLAPGKGGGGLRTAFCEKIEKEDTSKIKK